MNPREQIVNQLALLDSEITKLQNDIKSLNGQLVRIDSVSVNRSNEDIAKAKETTINTSSSLDDSNIRYVFLTSNSYTYNSNSTNKSDSQRMSTSDYCCSRCGRSGHNIRTCTYGSNKKHCSNCGRSGHNIQTCRY